MSYTPGFVKVHRSLLDWEWYSDDRCVRLLLHLSLKANFMDRKWRGEALRPGQLITSAQSLADQLKWSRSAVNRTLDKLRDCGEVTTESDNRWTLITLAKWGQMQSASENSDNEQGNDRTTDDTATGQRMTQLPDTAKEGEEGKNLKKGRREENNTAPVALIWPSWATEKFGMAWEHWKKYKAENRQKYKPTGEQAALSKLANEFTNEVDAIAAINHSMGNGWRGIFAPRQQNGNGHGKPSGYDQRRAAFAQLFSEEQAASNRGTGDEHEHAEGV